MKNKILLCAISSILFLTCKTKESICTLPSRSNPESISVSISSNAASCTDVYEGFDIKLDWAYKPNSQDQTIRFAFEGITGFDILEGTASDRTNPNITLIPREDAPEKANIEVYAYNECGESNRGHATINVQKTPPYIFNTRLSLPEGISHPATFTYNGKGYIAGGKRSATGTANIYVYDPTNHSISQLPPVLHGDEESAAVVGDTAYLTRNAGRYIEVYHIPSNSLIREMEYPNAFPDPDGHLVNIFANGDKLYFGPLSLLGGVISYDVTNGVFTNIANLHNSSGYACTNSYIMGDHIYYFRENGLCFDLNTNTGENGPLDYIFASTDNFITSFAVGNKGYVFTNDTSLKYSAAGFSFEAMSIDDCAAHGWSKPANLSSNFVIGDKVYFVGGQEIGGGALLDSFQGLRL